MTGGVKLEFPATTINEAVMTATEKWRVLVEDPEATLPWSTHFEFYEDADDPEVQDGKIVDGPVRTRVLARIEFDNKIVDQLTGSGGAG